MKKSFHQIVLATILLFSVVLIVCTRSSELGTEDNPVKIYFLPSIDAKVIESNSKIFKKYLEEKTPYKFSVMTPQSFIAVVEAFGTKRADVAVINSFGYILAREKYGVEAKLTVLRDGVSTYQSQFITRADSGIQTLKDLDGKKIAFVDPASTSGYLLPLKTLKDRGIKPKETVFAMKHDSVVSMVYQGQVDAGATFYSLPSKKADGTEQAEDARRLVKTQYPDVMEKIKIIELSSPIPNDPVIFRKDIPENMKNEIVNALIKFTETSEGKKAFSEIYGVTEVRPATDADYDDVRAMLKSLGKSATDVMGK